MEFLKETLGDELYAQFAEKMKDSKIKLADIAGGAYVGKDKFSALEAEKTGLTAQITDANRQIAEFTKMDVDGIKKAADEWKGKYEQAEKDNAAKIADMEYTATLKEALSGEKFSSVYARDGVMAEIQGKKLPLDGGKIAGLSDVLEQMKKDKPDAFAAEQQPPPNLRGAGMGLGGQPAGNLTGKEAAMAAAQKAMGIILPKG